MRFFKTLALVILLLSEIAHAGESRPPTQEQSDFLTYIRSAGAEAMNEKCQSVMNQFPDMDANIEAWRAQNQEAIDRGRQATASRLKDGKTIEQYETEFIDSLKALWAKTPADRLTKQCIGFVASTVPKKAD